MHASFKPRLCRNTVHISCPHVPDSGGRIRFERSCASRDPSQAANIVLVVTDELGIDRWKLFGLGRDTPLAMQNIERSAYAGVTQYFTSNGFLPLTADFHFLSELPI